MLGNRVEEHPRLRFPAGMIGVIAFNLGLWMEGREIDRGQRRPLLLEPLTRTSSAPRRPARRSSRVRCPTGCDDDQEQSICDCDPRQIEDAVDELKIFTAPDEAAIGIDNPVAIEKERAIHSMIFTSGSWSMLSLAEKVCFGR